ncbi:hypothetical protein [uncultured Thiohalocapsa sp.]|uniref:hypothetical protein n=1 Tax=uncultured Thiohalocapsa sp. TaxID=768990 RepID=UPI0025F1B5FB|nr:hypothetical protein [uncultured Thiohalocapsa sp.]
MTVFRIGPADSVEAFWVLLCGDAASGADAVAPQGGVGHKQRIDRSSLTQQTHMQHAPVQRASRYAA